MPTYEQAKKNYELAKTQLYLNQDKWDKDNEHSDDKNIVDKWHRRCDSLRPDYEAVAAARREMIPLIPIDEADLHPAMDCADIMSLEEFKDNVECGGFVDDDGSGYFILGGKETDIPAYPSDFKAGLDASRFDGVAWYNK